MALVLPVGDAWFTGLKALFGSMIMVFIFVTALINSVLTKTAMFRIL